MRPEEIEAESMRLIRLELASYGFSAPEFAIVSRVVHATADPDFARYIRFHPQAIAAGIEALRHGCCIVTDVRMVEAGISKRRLASFGVQTVCGIDSPEVVAMAATTGETRAALAMRHCAKQMQGAIVAIGNAPTALLEVIRLCREGAVHPALIVGVPVGYVQAAEFKSGLLELDFPYITIMGRKGGSAVAVAIVNALLRLAEAQT